MTPESEIRHVLARYVRATDHRDSAAMTDLFTHEGKVRIFYNRAGDSELIAELIGAEAIGAAVTQMMKPHPPLGWSHHTTSDHIVEVDGDEGSIDAQFVVFNVVGDEMPAEGWPPGAHGAQGRITPIETGYYRSSMRRIDGAWRIVEHRIVLDLPMALPA